MQSLIVVAVTFALLWFLFIRPQQRRVREHSALVASVQPGDEVVLSAGIYGRIVDLGPDELTLEVAPGVELRVARQAILRLVEQPVGGGSAGPPAIDQPDDRPFDESDDRPDDESSGDLTPGPADQRDGDGGPDGDGPPAPPRRADSESDPNSSPSGPEA
jgi:preprotein translocase subunit YajC